MSRMTLATRIGAALTLALATACATTADNDMPKSHETLDVFELGVLPRPLAAGSVLLRPKKRFVMVNLLVFKEKATEPHIGLSGREAYLRYAATVEQIQGPEGSKLLWSGDITQQLVGHSEPRFEVGALLEYASPGAFIKFAVGGKSDTKARAAGLEGQWLLACTTERVSDIPPGGVGLVEIVGQSDNSSRPAWTAAVKTHGGREVWSGRVDQHVIGKASPAVERVVLHWLPDEEALTGLLTSDSFQRMKGDETLPRPWWVFSATTADLLPGLR
ncbi:MAG: hypothetical protein GY822_24055 [Deltaproteobacteria bacterium]|nr:hypothetical protein [Deltaproteobacteria bacterium]